MTQPICINLLNLFEHFYRITYSEEYDPAGVPRRCLNKWMMQIPCKFGAIVPAGGKSLAWSCEGHAKIRNRVKALERVRVQTEGNRDLTVTFDVTDFGLVAGIVKPFRKPGMSAAEREKRSRRMCERNSK